MVPHPPAAPCMGARIVKCKICSAGIVMNSMTPMVMPRNSNVMVFVMYRVVAVVVVMF